MSAATVALTLYRGAPQPPAPEPQGWTRNPVDALDSTQLTDNAYRLLGALLAGVYSQATVVCKTHQELQRLTRKSESTVKRGLRELEARGWIERTEHQGRPAFRLRFRLRGPEEKPPAPAPEPAPPAGSKPAPPAGSKPAPPAGSKPTPPGATAGPGRGQERPPGGARIDPPKPGRKEERARAETPESCAKEPPGEPAGRPARSGATDRPAVAVAGETPAKAADEAAARAQLEQLAAATSPRDPFARVLRRFLAAAPPPEKTRRPRGSHSGGAPGAVAEHRPPIVTGVPGPCKRGRLQPPAGPGPDGPRPA